MGNDSVAPQQRHSSISRSAEPRCVIVLHIPKTAGSSLLSIVRRNYSPKHRWEFRGADWPQQIADFSRSPPADADRIRCLMGHVPYGVHRLLPIPCTYITLMRDPVDLTLSLYYALLTKPQRHDSLKVVAREHMPLDVFVDHLQREGNGNLQTRFIGGFLPMEQVLPPYPRLPANALEIARANLERSFSEVGLVEHFDASVLLMRDALGWRNAHYARENVTGQRPRDLALTDAQRDRILQCHSLDAALYESVRRNFLKRLEHLQPAFARKLARYKRTNSIYEGATTRYRQLRRIVGRVKRQLLRRPIG